MNKFLIETFTENNPYGCSDSNKSRGMFFAENIFHLIGSSICRESFIMNFRITVIFELPFLNENRITVYLQ